MSNQYKADYVERKNRVIECLNKAEQFMKDNGCEDEAKSLAVQRKNIEDGEFTISVIGEFSAGKSTFLNALMGERILPSFTSETTATINFLRHKDKSRNGVEGGRVQYNDGHEEYFDGVTLTNVIKYVSTSSDINVKDSVKCLDLYLGSDFLKDNVTLVDTPGLNGIAEGHAKMTMEQISESSAGIFLFDAHKPGSETDFKFLGELCKKVNNVIFVLNQIDAIKETEGETVEAVIDKLKQNYKLKFPDAETIPEIYPISAILALANRAKKEKVEVYGTTEYSEEKKREYLEKSRIEAFESRLMKFLTQGEKTLAMLKTPLQQMQNKLMILQDKNTKELDALNGSTDASALESKQIDLENAIQKLNENVKEQTSEIRKNLSEYERNFIEAIKSGCENVKKRIEKKVDCFQDIEEISESNIDDVIKRSFFKVVDDAYNDYGESLRNCIELKTGEMFDSLDIGMTDSIKKKYIESVKFEIHEGHINWAQYEEAKDKVQKEIDALQTEISQLEDDVWTQSELKNKRKDLERKLESINERRDAYERMRAATTPDVRSYEKEIMVEDKASGFFSFLRRILVGKKYHTERRMEIDSSDQNNYRSDTNKTLEKYDSQILQIEQDIKSLPSEDAGLERLYNQKSNKMHQKEEALNRLTAKYNEEIRSKNEAVLRKQKNEIRDFTDSLCDEFIKDCKQNFLKEKTNSVKVIEECIAGTVVKEIELKQKELANLKTQQESSVKDRDSRIAILTEQNDKIKAMLAESFEIKSELDSITVDTIKKEILV